MVGHWLVASLLVSAWAQPADRTRFDFEDGTLQGWTVVSGDLGKQPTNATNDRHGDAFAKQGTYFIGTFETYGDKAVGEMRSPEFMLHSDWITLLVGGGNKPDDAYVALVRASDGKELFKETGRESETMVRRFWDVKQYAGERVYFKLVDRATEGWCHINVDDVGEATPDEARAYAEAARKQKEKRDRWYADLMKPAGRTPYKGVELQQLAMQMGGIGAGNIALCGDGRLRAWQIFNKVNTGCVVPGQMFALWSPGGARVLSLKPDDGLPGVAEIEAYGEFPLGELVYRDTRLPVNVKLTAFSPFIPMNPRDSGIPGVYYIFTLTNRSKSPVSVSLLATMQNAANYDELSPIGGTQFEEYGGNVNRVVRSDGMTAIDMGIPDLSSDAPQYGTMTLAALSPKATAKVAWDGAYTLWAEFQKAGRVAEPPTYSRSRSPETFAGGDPLLSQPSPPGKTWNGALAVPVTLKPGETKQVPFLITWHFPNHYADYDRNLAKYRLGHMYSRWFKDALAAATYMAGNYPRLKAETLKFHDTFFDSTLPYWMLRRIASQAGTMTSQSTLWTEQNTFCAFEGCGCCPMNCTHVYNYEQAISWLFPALERIMRETDLGPQLMDTGGVRHRTVLPLSAPRGFGPFVDGQLGTILKAYREHLHSKDGAWLTEWWPRIKRALDFAVREWDPNHDGVLVNEQWNTYDAAMYGPNTFIGTLYLGALRAGEEMARLQRDQASADAYHKLFESGSQRLDEALWNGEYYIHIDQKKPGLPAWITEDWPRENPQVNLPYGPGCHADQLLGQWWADMLALGNLLPPDHVDKTLDSIMEYDWREDFAEVPQQRYFAGEGDRGLLNCTWPKGGRPAQATLYSDEVWTGIEYEVAGLMLHRGRAKESFQIVRAIDDRYNGVARAPIERDPWNEIECGDHYARAMSSWSVLLAAQGCFYDGPRGLLRFGPVLTPEHHRSFFSTAEGWGTFDQSAKAGVVTSGLSVKYGSIDIRVLKVAARFGATPSVALNGKPVTTVWKRQGADLALTFMRPLTLRQGDLLRVTERLP